MISLIGRSEMWEWLQNVIFEAIPDSKVHGANMGPIWDPQNPGGLHVGPMNFAIWDVMDKVHQHFLSNCSQMNATKAFD